MEEGPLKILLVDDNKIFRKGIKFYIENILQYDVIEECTNGEEFLNSENIINANIILMDIEMPKINGIEASKKALWKMPTLKILAITNYKDKAYLTELIGAGIKGCVFKDDIYNELEKAIRTILAGDIYYPEDIKL